jgi:3',5'-cyclic AMP phosphodiesterase CpdA
MALLLHLSDLHLATADDGDVVADRKEDVIALGKQQTRLGILKNSMRALGESLLQTDSELDSILISGDITVRGDQEGFDLLDSVLDCLGAARPAAERILIIPGNHDVVRFTEPSSVERYERFLTLRTKPYKMAYLEGVDLDADGKALE